jgi:hypothetical protein
VGANAPKRPNGAGPMGAARHRRPEDRGEAVGNHRQVALVEAHAGQRQAALLRYQAAAAAWYWW